jgi:hypothetical protein
VRSKELEDNLTTAMKRQISVMLVFLLFLLASGCGLNRASVENRRVNSIQFVQQTWVNSKHKSEVKMGREVLDALIASNSNTLEQPEIASAYIAGFPNLTNLNQVYYFDFYVLWIEDRPSVNEVEFSLPGLDSNIELPISDADANDNQTLVDKSVIFTARNQWTKGSKIGDMLDSLTDGNNLKVRLLRDQKAVTEWYPVSFIKMGQWIVNVPGPHQKN